MSTVRPFRPSRHHALPLHALALACALATSLMAAAPSARAQQSTGTTTQAVLAFDQPAQPLGEAVNALARHARVQIIFAASATEGFSAPALRGSYTVRQALDRLLAGTGLMASQSGNAFTIQAQTRSPETALKAVTVTAQYGLGGATEGTGQYTTGAMNTATRMALSPRETPQSVSVLTRAQIDDQNLTTLDDAVQQITGLTMQKGYYTGDSGSFNARGFPVSNLLLDGVPTSAGANGTFNADNDALDIYDRVEVVRGATGLTTGAGTPSAAINLVRKRPTAEIERYVMLSAGSWDNYRAMVDAGGPLNEAGTLRGRAVATVQDSDKFYDVAHDRNHQLYGILEADLTPDTMATLGFHYRKVDNDGLLPGLPTNPDGSFLSGVSRSTNLANDFDYWKQTDQTVFAELIHNFANGWQAKAAAVWKRPEQDMVFSGLYRNGGILRQNTQSYRLDNEQDSYDLSLNGPFSLFGRTHELMLGASYRSRDNLNWGGWAAYSWTADGPAVDPYNWDSSAVRKPDIDMTLWGIDATTRQKAVYAATRLNISDPLKVIIGTRIDWYRHDNHRNDTSYRVNQELTPYFGAIYDLDDQHSAYASWTEIFEPQGSYDSSGKLLDPITGTNYEIGIKGKYFGGRLNASLAAFLIKQQNRATDDLAGPNPCPGSAWGYCQRASGEVESKGIELEVSGALTPDWQLMAGYTYVAAKYTKDAERSNIGRLLNPSLPRHQFKLSTSYRLPGELRRWRVGGNLYAQNGIKASEDSRIRQSGYAVVGLHTAYSVDKQTEIRLNIHNLFDKRYYQTIGWDAGGNVFGTPRNFTLSAQYSF